MDAHLLTHPAIALARERGSIAATSAGAIRYLRAHPRQITPLPLDGPVRATDHGSAADYHVAASDARILRSHSVEISNIGLIGRYCRYVAASGRDTTPRILVRPGNYCEMQGYGYGFRWRGKWKSAPGSYIPSSRRIEAGLTFLARVCRDLRESAYGGTRCIYRAETAIHKHGYTAYRARTIDGEAIWYVEAAHSGRRKPWAYHATAKGRTACAAIREAVHARRIQRDADRMAAIERSRYSSVWITVDDSLATGNCEPITRAVARQIEHALGAEGPVGAVRGDILIAHRDDFYTRRALAYAAQRRSA